MKRNSRYPLDRVPAPIISLALILNLVALACLVRVAVAIVFCLVR